jgi:hypothetical protein
MIDHIQILCGIGAIGSPTIIYEDNDACVAQMQTGYAKTNYTKHISPNLFYPHQLQKSGEINILQIKSYDNYADLFIKSLPLAIFDKCVKGRLKDLHDQGRNSLNKFPLLGITLYYFSFMSFYVVSHKKIFNEAMCRQDDVYLLIFL